MGCPQKILVGKYLSKNAKWWLKNLRFGEIFSEKKIEILTTHDLLCWKFAAVFWKIASSCAAYFI